MTSALQMQGSGVRGTLSKEEKLQFSQCEDVLRKGWITFVEVGNALATIKELRLYREKYARFEDYCRDQWQCGRAYAYQLIGASQAVNHLSAIPDITNLPKHESQVRPLIGLTPEQIRETWKNVLVDSTDGKITARLVKEHAAKFKRNGNRQKSSKQQPQPSQKSIKSKNIRHLVQMLDELQDGISTNQPVSYLLCNIKKIRDLLIGNA